MQDNLYLRILHMFEDTFSHVEANICLQEEAEQIVRACLKQVCSADMGIDSLPVADYNRHNVVGDRMCLCQLYEDNKSTINQRRANTVVNARSRQNDVNYSNVI